ncbi:MAG: tetratricopeptide repeat protein [Flammeovirgaceae bacterium]
MHAGIEIDSLKTKLDESKGTERIDILNQLSVLHRNNNTEWALHYAKEAMRQSSAKGDKHRLAQSYINAGVILRNTGGTEKALEYFFSAAELASDLDSTLLKADALHKISVAYLLVRDFDEALKFGKEEEIIWRELKNEHGLASALNSIGLIYLNTGRYDEANSFLIQALELAEKSGDKALIYKPLLNLGDLFLYKKDPDRALDYINKSAAICEELNDKYGIAITLLKKGEAYHLQNKYEEAIEAALAANRQANELHSLSLVRNTYRTLAMVYESAGKYKKALDYDRLYISTEDSMLSEVTRREIAQLEARYEVEEKQREIDRMLKEATYSKMRVMSLIGFIVLFAVLAVVFISRQQLKQRAKYEIVTRNDEINRQSEELVEQKEIIERKSRELDKTVNYAKFIQNTVMHINPSFLNIFTDYFAFNQPKDEASGDFCWFAHKSDSIVIAIGDCTGHGVEGAFNTVIGNSLLTQIVSENQYRTPADILKELDKKLSGISDPNSDLEHIFRPNMKLAICSININNKRMVYAGAKIPLYLMSGGKLKIVEADPWAIAGYDDDVVSGKAFNNRIINLKKGDKLLFFTDGFQRQLGGTYYEDYSIEQQNELVNTIKGLGLPLQKEEVIKQFESWKGDNEQTDDVTIFGLEI